MNKKYQAQSGRSFVEMLGTLAIMGVLSIGAIAGFNYAMNKHRANEILDEARKRAYTVMTQIQLGLRQSLSDYDRHNAFAGGTFGSNIVTEGLTGQFGLKITGVKKAVCQNILKTIGEQTILRRLTNDNDLTATLSTCPDGEDDYILIYNNDLTPTILAYELKTEADCQKAGKKWCSAIKGGSCVESDCCADRDIATCKTCNTETGKISNAANYLKCDYSTTEKGYCSGGKCIFSNKLCITNEDCSHLIGEYFCKYINIEREVGDLATALGNYTGICEKASNTEYIERDVDGIGLLRQSTAFGMSWWNAKNWCEAQTVNGRRGQLINISNNRFDCYYKSGNSYIPFSENTFSKYCCANGYTTCDSSPSNQSTKMQAFRSAGFEAKTLWTQSGGTGRSSLTINTSGEIGIAGKGNSAHFSALCEF